MTPKQTKDLIENIWIGLWVAIFLLGLPYWPLVANIWWHGPRASGYLIWWSSFGAGAELVAVGAATWMELERLAINNLPWRYFFCDVIPPRINETIKEAINS